MSRKIVGLGFCCISALLYATRYIAGAIYGSGVAMDGGYGESSFKALVNYTGEEILYISIAAFLIGVAYLVWSEFEKK